MELLFGKYDCEEKNSEELKELLGTIDSDLSFKKLKPMIIDASVEMQRIIGKETYNYAIALYKSPSSEDNKDDHLYKIRYPIAQRALSFFLPLNDVRVTDNGRQITKNEDVTAAFEYQTVNHDKAVEKSYYRSLDILFEYFEESNPVIFKDGETEKKWKDTSIYKASQNLLIKSTLDFDSIYPIENRYLYQKLIPAIVQCETFEIIPRIGKSCLNELKTNNQENQELLLACKNATAYYALAWAIKRFSVQLMPNSVMQLFESERNTIKASKVSEKREKEWAAQEFLKDVDRYLLIIEELVKPDTVENNENQSLDLDWDDNENFITI